jgi:hypothetical protein
VQRDSAFNQLLILETVLLGQVCNSPLSNRLNNAIKPIKKAVELHAGSVDKLGVWMISGRTSNLLSELLRRYCSLTEIQSGWTRSEVRGMYKGEPLK